MALHSSITSLILFGCLLFSTPGMVSAAVHYFVVQGNFDTTTTAVETYKFKITDTNGALEDGQSVMNAVFGTPTRVGSTNEFRTTGSGFDVSYTYYEDYGAYLINSIKLTSSTDYLATNAGTGLSWSYYNAGGGYTDAYLPPNYDTPMTGPYGDGSWTYSYTGQAQRTLLDIDGDGNVDASYDGWVFGSDGYTEGPGEVIPPAATITGLDNLPLDSNFTGPGTSVTYGNGVTVFSYAAAPEPGRPLLVMFALAGLCIQRKRKPRIENF